MKRYRIKSSPTHFVLLGLICVANTDFSYGRVIGNDSRQRVTSFASLNTEPWSAVGQVFARFADGSWSSGSGTMVSAHHMLTAAHVIYDAAHGGYPTSIEFFPQRNGQLANSRLYARNRGTPYVPAQWRSNENFDYDYALVPLDRTLGNYTSWMDIQSYEDNLRSYSHPEGHRIVINTAGYPGDLPNSLNHDDPNNGLVMYSTDGVPDAIQSNSMMFWTDAVEPIGFGLYDYVGMDWFEGQSGSPLWTTHISDLRRKVVGVLSYETPEGINVGLKINDSIAFDLGVRMAFSPVPNRGILGQSVTVDAPVELADLVHYDQWFGTSLDAFGDQVLRPGDGFSPSLRVHNNGTIASGTVSAALYLSLDDSIGTDDIQLFTRELQSISPFASSGLTIVTALPMIPAGTYNIGWIIDPLNSIAEYDETDNGFRIGTLTVPGLPGDFNHDNTVDAADYVMWRKTSSSERMYWTLWRQHFGQVHSESNGQSIEMPSVPEPSSVASMAIPYGLAMCLLTRRCTLRSLSHESKKKRRVLLA